MSISSEALQGSIWVKMVGSREQWGKNAQAGSLGLRKQRNLGGMANLAREQTKYGLGSREQRGHFTTGAWSMGPPLQSLSSVSNKMICTSYFPPDIDITVPGMNRFCTVLVSGNCVQSCVLQTCNGSATPPGLHFDRTGMHSSQ